MRILLFQTAFLGDLLLSTVFLKNLKACYPGAKVDLVARAPFGKFFEAFGLVHSVYSVNKKDSDSLKQLENSLKEQSYDIVFCPHESFRSAVLCGKIKAEKKYSFRRWFSFLFFNRLVTRPLDLPDVLRQTSLLAAANPEFGRKWVEFVSAYRGAKEQILADFSQDRVEIPEFLSMQLELDSQTIEKHLEGVPELAEEFICIAPGSVWETKKWREEHYIEFSKGRREKVVILGGPGEEELCARIAMQIPGSVNLAGKTSLLQLFCVLKKAKFLVCNDSGTMHMATCAGTPLISNFGPTTLDIGYRPWSNKSVVNQIDLKCRPCGLHGHDKCPLGTHDCMKLLSPSQLEAKTALLGRFS